MTNNTQFKTLVNTWLNQKKPMITPSTHASFTLITENHLIPYFGKRKIGSITEADIQSYISYLYNAGRLDKTGGLTVKTIRDVILVLRLSIGPPKTKTSARTIPVPSLLMNIIKKFYTENPNHYFLTGKTKPTEPRTYRQFFTRFLKRNGLEKVKFHEIRHTFAVRAIEIPEFDIKSLSEILGHKNVSFTLNVYGSANLQQKVKCMNLLNDLL